MKSSSQAIALLLLLCVVSLPQLGCDSASPLAPQGTTISISANPDRIASDGTSTIRVVAQRPNGTPVNPGTIIRLTTTLGLLPPTVATDAAGEANATLEANGEFGTATISAATGATEAATVDVQLGLPAGAISIQATPTSVPETGGTVSLVALVRDDQGQPLANAQVNFRTDVGSLLSAGGLLLTDAGGSASDELEVTTADLDPVTGDNFNVVAEVGTGGNLLNSTISITIQRLPRADFTFGTNNLTVVFQDTSTGRPTSWLWDFGDGNTSSRQNPTHTYAAADTYVVSLRATNSQGSDTISNFVSVTGQ